MRIGQWAWLLPLLAGVCAGSASAQGLVYTFGDSTNGDDFGRSVADAGDVDNDGFPDVIVGAPFDDANGTSSGSVFVYSGKTGGLIWTRAGDFAGDLFGWAVDGIGDIDGDGTSEVLVGAPGWDGNGAFGASSGKLFVLRGTGGFSMTEFLGNETGAGLGSVVRGLGDIDGDGVGDFAYGSPSRDWAGVTDSGYMAVYSGQGVQFLFSRKGAEVGARYGYSIDVVRATGAEATSRLIVGSPGVDGPGVERGLVTLMDGFGNTVSLFQGSSNYEWLGAAVAGVGDVNNDGHADYAFSAPYRDFLFVGADAGTVLVYSGFSTSLLFSQVGSTAGALFGLYISGCGDFDGDGHDDLLVGAPNDDFSSTDGGLARLISGATGGTIQSWYGGFNDHMGFGVSGAGDLNGDSFADVIIGAKDAPNGAGLAWVYLGGVDEASIYCVAKVNSQGCTPEIGISGIASSTIANSLHVTASNVLNNQFGMMFWGVAPGNVPFQGGTLCVQTPVRRTSIQLSNGNAGPSDCSGTYDFHFSHAFMAAESISRGTHVHAQFWSRDPFAPGPGLTNAVSFYVIP